MIGKLCRRALPLSTSLERGEATALAGCFAALLAIIAITAANAIFGLGGQVSETAIRDFGSSIVYILVAAIVALRAIRTESKRTAWILFALALSLYGLGNVLWSLWVEHMRNVPIPSVCDALWLTLYPLSYGGIVVLARGRENRLVAGVWLDGIISGAGLGALGAALVVRPVLASATGSPVAVGTELAYPVGDLLLAILVVGVLALRGWRVSRMWALLATGFVSLAVADCMYAVQVAGGSSSPSAMTNLVYVVSVALLAFAAWQADTDAPEEQLERWSMLLVPAGFTLTAVGLLIYDHAHRLDLLGLTLACVTLIAAILRMALAFRDVQSLAEARRQATTDDLTSLPNRRLFMRRVREAIAAARLTGGELAVLLMDVDRFKELNDTLGHQAGDALLCLIGPRLKRVLRSGDVVARLGGDEFAVLLDPQPSPEGIVRVAEKLLAALHEPFDVQGLALRVTASLGIASFPAHAGDADVLIRRADVAMYQAKAARDGYQFYARDRDTNSRERLMLAAELAEAIECGQIEVHFQPKALTGTGEIVGAEALVRWRRPDGSTFMPGQFVDAAGQAGLSRALTRKVLDLALAQIATWRRAGHDIHVAVNTTVADLLDEDFPSEVAARLDAHGLAPAALILEVTESSVMSDPVRIANVLARLRELGIELSLDDFGTGYSSLTHLRTLPVGEVKVDRSFVARMQADATDAAIVDATIDLSHKLGIRVVAEGVEDEETRRHLAALGCEVVQGYLLGRPGPAADLERRLGADTTGLHHAGEPAGPQAVEERT